MRNWERTLACAIGLLLATGLGCALTDYSLITDNNQTSAGGGPGEIRDTRGKAKLLWASQWVTEQADGTDELLWFVNQTADGAQTLTTHNNFSVAGDATFADDPPQVLHGEDELVCHGAGSLPRSAALSTGRRSTGSYRSSIRLDVSSRPFPRACSSA